MITFGYMKLVVNCFCDIIVHHFHQRLGPLHINSLFGTTEGFRVKDMEKMIFLLTLLDTIPISCGYENNATHHIEHDYQYGFFINWMNQETNSSSALVIKWKCTRLK